MEGSQILDLKSQIIASYGANHLGVSKNRGGPQIISFNKDFHYFHPPFWGKTPLFFG